MNKSKNKLMTLIQYVYNGMLNPEQYGFKMIFFVRSSLAKYDARIQKYFNALRSAGIVFKYVGWARGISSYHPNENEILYLREGRLGARWLNSFSLIKWNIFLFLTLFKNRANLKIVHVIDLDSALTVYFFCIIFRKNIIFDVYDKYTAVRNISGPIGAALNFVERHIARHADMTILAGAERYKQMGLEKVQPNVIVLENVPSSSLSSTEVPTFAGKWLVGYLGVLEAKHRGLENLIHLATKHKNIELHVAGYGDLEKYLTHDCNQFTNIIYHGPVNAHDGLKLMARMHLVVGMYYLSIPNHFYAAPNKYYEHLMLGRGLLTTQNTPPGERVCEFGTGWAIGEGGQALESWFSSLEMDQVTSAGIQAKQIWERYYKNYYDDYYRGLYIQRIEQILKDTDV